MHGYSMYVIFKPTYIYTAFQKIFPGGVDKIVNIFSKLPWDVDATSY